MKIYFEKILIFVSSGDIKKKQKKKLFHTAMLQNEVYTDISIESDVHTLLEKAWFFSQLLLFLCVPKTNKTNAWIICTHSVLLERAWFFSQLCFLCVQKKQLNCAQILMIHFYHQLIFSYAVAHNHHKVWSKYEKTVPHLNKWANPTQAKHTKVPRPTSNAV